MSKTTVVQNILRRAERRRAGNFEPDGRKLALVIEGGGMRSVHSAAGAVALAQLGFSDIFDEVYATSGGVMNAAYFMTDQAVLGISVLFENCVTPSFLNYWRFWKMLNIDYIVDTVAGLEKKLDLERIRNSRTKLLVAACDHGTGEPHLIDVQTTPTPLPEVLRASMAVPVFYNRTVAVEGRYFVDCGTILPFTLEHAIERDCTDILVMLTRPASFVEQQPHWAQQWAFRLLHGRGKHALCQAFAMRRDPAQRVRDLATGRIPPPPDVNITSVCPEEGDVLTNSSTPFHLTYPAAVHYGGKIMEMFGHDPQELVLQHRPFWHEVKK